jgi:hypothetical protein
MSESNKIPSQGIRLGFFIDCKLKLQVVIRNRADKNLCDLGDLPRVNIF